MHACVFRNKCARSGDSYKTFTHFNIECKKIMLYHKCAHRVRINRGESLGHANSDARLKTLSSSVAYGLFESLNLGRGAKVLSHIEQRVEHLEMLGKLRKEFAFIRGNYLILVLSWILMDFAGELAAPYYPEYVRQLGATESIVGAVGFVAFIALASVQFPGGFLADKYGRKWLVSTLTFGVALSYIFFAVAPTWHFIMIGTLVANLCLLYQPALLAMMADSMPPERRGMGYSIINLIMSVTTTPAAAVGLTLVVQYGLVEGLRVGYTIIVVFFLAAATLRLRLKESIKKNPGKMQLSELVNSYPKALKEGIGIWKLVPRSTFFLFISGLLVRLSFAMTQFNMLFYALDELLISEAIWGLATIALFSTMIIFAFPAGKLIDKIGHACMQEKFR